MGAIDALVGQELDLNVRQARLKAVNSRYILQIPAPCALCCTPRRLAKNPSRSRLELQNTC